jgi:hypothetical protein
MQLKGVQHLFILLSFLLLGVGYGIGRYDTGAIPLAVFKVELSLLLLLFAVLLHITLSPVAGERLTRLRHVIRKNALFFVASLVFSGIFVVSEYMSYWKYSFAQNILGEDIRYFLVTLRFFVYTFMVVPAVIYLIKTSADERAALVGFQAGLWVVVIWNLLLFEAQQLENPGKNTAAAQLVYLGPFLLLQLSSPSKGSLSLWTIPSLLYLFVVVTSGSKGLYLALIEPPRVSRRLIGFNHATAEHSC